MSGRVHLDAPRKEKVHQDALYLTQDFDPPRRCEPGQPGHVFSCNQFGTRIVYLMDERGGPGSASQAAGDDRATGCSTRYRQDCVVAGHS